MIAFTSMVDKIVDNPRVSPADQLREAIVSGRLQPNERLVEMELTRALGVGRSAVRTALARLEHEGLVEHERHRGARDGDAEDLQAILATMRGLLDSGDLLSASDENAALHRRVLEIAGHTTATRLISTLQPQLVRFQYRTILLPGRSERSFVEHRAIVEAIAAHDPDAAEAAMRRHLSQVAETLRAAASR